MGSSFECTIIIKIRIEITSCKMTKNSKANVRIKDFCKKHEFIFVKLYGIVAIVFRMNPLVYVLNFVILSAMERCVERAFYH